MKRALQDLAFSEYLFQTVFVPRYTNEWFSNLTYPEGKTNCNLIKMLGLLI